jgi:hypothetical protein
VSELWATAREAVRALAGTDPGLRRFGAAGHRYALAPPLGAAAIAEVEARIGELPDELRGYASELAAGGAGPGYGIVPLAHLGCGYAAVVALDGQARGEVWIDARAIGVARPIHSGMTALYLDWIDRLAHARWPEPHVPAGACALAAALSGYLARCEAEQGLAAGALAGPALREALERLGPGAIEIAAEASAGGCDWFDDGDRVDPCIACARLIANLAGDGLRRDVVAPGALPRPLRCD